MRITYANKKVERYFVDYGEMKRKIPAEWVRTIKKHVDRLIAADRFRDFLKLNLGHPEPLKGKDADKWSVRVSGNVWLILRLNEPGDAVIFSEEVEMKGVVDYHGDKESLYIP